LQKRTKHINYKEMTIDFETYLGIMILFKQFS